MADTSRIKEAKAYIKAFAEGKGKPAFLHMDRKKVAMGLTRRVDDPEVMNQKKATLCGPFALVYGLALHQPLKYVQLVTELFEHGKAKFKEWELKPCRDLRSYKLPEGTLISQCDWIPCASFRDSGNWFFDYEKETDRGGTKASEIITWLKKAGYSDIQDDYSKFDCEERENLQEADNLRAAGYHVMMLINAEFFKDVDSNWSLKSNHWVVLASPVKFTATTVDLKLYSWGRLIEVSAQKKVKNDLKRFLAHYYGYVACKF